MNKTTLHPGIWKIALLGFATAVIVLLTAIPVWACPNCKDNLHNQAGNLQLGMALSILLMLGSPLTILAFWVFWYFRYFQKALRPLGFVENHVSPITETTR